MPNHPNTPRSEPLWRIRSQLKVRLKLLSNICSPDDDLVRFGSAGMVGMISPRTSNSAFSNFTHIGIYPGRSKLKQFPLGFVKRKFPNSYTAGPLTK